MNRLIVCGLAFVLATTIVTEVLVAQPGRRQGSRNNKSDQPKQPRLPDDPRLMVLHKKFVQDASKLASEYERSRDWSKAKDVYQEILKLVPEYPPAKAKLTEMMGRLGTADRVTFEVDAAKGWQNTGVIVLEGKPITIRAAGSWTVVAEVGANGIELPEEAKKIKAIKEANIGSLLAAINTGNPEEDKPFVVGSQKSFTPNKPGQLYLSMHDIAPGDNKGSLKVEIVGTFEK